MYVYQCEECGARDEREYPIGTARRVRTCEKCGGTARQVLGVGVHIGAGALPNKRAGVTAIDSRERVLATDMDAYKRMRNRGLQPTHVDGSATVENQVGDQLDIDHARAYTLDPDCSREGVRDRIIEGYESAAQIRSELESA